MRLIAAVVRAAAEQVVDSLPRSEHEAGVFLAGMAWAFILFWSMLLLVTWAWARAVGAH